MSTYREIFKHAWQITYKNKILWFFGLFASLISFSAEIRVITTAISPQSGLKQLNELFLIMETGIFSSGAMSNFLNLVKTDLAAVAPIIISLLLILAILIFMIWLSTVSQIAIIDAAKKLNSSVATKLNLKKQLNNSGKSFWSVFIINFLSSLISNGVSFIIAITLTASIISGNWQVTLLYGFLFITLLPLTLLLSFIMKFSIAYIVIDKKKILDSIISAWRLFKNNWLVSIEIALSLFFINIVAVIAISIASLLVFSILTGAIAGTFLFIIPSRIGLLSFMALNVALAFAIIVLASAILNTFQISSWTNLFLKIKKNETQSKLARTFPEQNK